ncbi:non-heme iron oxygenase ferredoxin subunit [Candidatus Gottesmanbacteria bacterium]|nr:non-heme iron oxygenase ferredoxin subunit [Candidatus Gottesmanbacteria bacterium]
MGQSIKVLAVSDLPAGSMKTVEVDGLQIAIANVDGQYFAVDDICTHKHCSLGTKGFLDGTTLTCGCHGAQFDISSGAVMTLPATSGLRAYSVSIDNEAIIVHI